MGRLFKRVPIDFDYPLRERWYGNYFHIRECFATRPDDKICNQCKNTARILGIPLENYGCPAFGEFGINNIEEKLKDLFGVPQGSGFQIWENTTEGSPLTPVFESYEEMCQYAEDYGVSIFGGDTATKEEWMNALLIKGVKYD